MSDRLFMKLILVFFSCLSVFLMGCDPPDKKKAGIPSGVTDAIHQPDAGGPHASKESVVWGGEFRVSDTGRYKNFLRVCQRCGRFKVLPGGGFHYQASLADILFDEGPNKCENWLSQGYLQVQFTNRRLPTEAIVVFWPQFRSSNCWGHPFSAKGRALPVNESKGFKITLSPSDLSGQNEVSIRSEEGVPPAHTLSVSVMFERGDFDHSSRIFSTRLIRQKPEVKLPHINYTCHQIPPGPFHQNFGQTCQ